MMKLYLMRHADAEPMVGDKDTPGRKLTEKGRAQASEAAKKLKAKDVTFDVILTSPYARAVETAGIVAEALGLRDRMKKNKLLAPGSDIGKLITLMDEYKDMENVMFVGHEPDLGVFAGELLHLGAPRPLAKAEVVGVEIK
jgi:phosphohistidine phosphatase